MEKTFPLSKKEEISKRVDEFFPDINQDQIDEGQELFNETEVHEDTVQYVNFQLNSEFYAVEIAYVLEIIKMPRISFLPSAGAYVMGLINLRGNIIPVINTHKLFGLGSSTILEKSCVIILTIEKSNLGFLVDSVSQVLELRREDIDLPMVTLDMEKTAYILGEANIDGQLVAILDICKLVKNEIFVSR